MCGTNLSTWVYIYIYGTYRVKPNFNYKGGDNKKKV